MELLFNFIILGREKQKVHRDNPDVFISLLWRARSVFSPKFSQPTSPSQPTEEPPPLLTPQCLEKKDKPRSHPPRYIKHLETLLEPRILGSYKVSVSRVAEFWSPFG